jgi:hypothetical protein
MEHIKFATIIVYICLIMFGLLNVLVGEMFLYSFALTPLRMTPYCRNIRRGLQCALYMYFI